MRKTFFYSNDEPVSEETRFDHSIEWRKWIKRTTTLGRSAFDIYLAIKKREPVYFGVGIASLAEALEEWTKASSFDLHNEMRKRQLKPIFTQFQIMRFFHHTLKQMDLPYTQLKMGKEKNGGSSDYNVHVYTLGDVRLYFVFTGGSFLDYIFGKDKDEAIEALSHQVKEHLGQFIALTVSVENWSFYPGLTRAEARLEAYVSPIDLDDFCQATKKLQDKGLNRASLLFGPAGVGKTTFAGLVAKELDGRLLVIDSAALNRVTSSGIQLSELIDIVCPRVILFDDLDRVFDTEVLFGEIENLNRMKGRSEILMLGSVNHLEKLPEPLRRPGRFDEIIEFPLPDPHLRQRILISHLSHLGMRLKNGFVGDVVEWSEEMSGADLREIALQISIRGFDARIIKDRIEYMKKLKQVGKEEEEPVGQSNKEIVKSCRS